MHIESISAHELQEWEKATAGKLRRHYPGCLEDDHTHFAHLIKVCIDGLTSQSDSTERESLSIYISAFELRWFPNDSRTKGAAERMRSELDARLKTINDPKSPENIPLTPAPFHRPVRGWADPR